MLDTTWSGAIRVLNTVQLDPLALYSDHKRDDTIGRRRASGSGSVVERLLAKEKVAGSNPVFRSIFCSNALMIVAD